MAFNKKRFVPRPKIKENINEGIRFQIVRVIFPDGANEILPTNIALQKARSLDLDLIVISPTSVPPVAKIQNEGKYLFEQKKRKQEAKANQHVTKIKEVKFRPGTGEHDYEFKKNHCIEFLKEKHKVKAVCQFKGREIAHVDLGIALLTRLVVDMAEFGKAEAAPRQEGKQAFVLIGPVSR